MMPWSPASSDPAPMPMSKAPCMRGAKTSPRWRCLVEKTAPSRALDMGSGGGHVAYLMARHANAVAAVDLSAEMLAAVAETAKSKGLANIETHRASVERLPFADGSFDLVVSRYSAHHWHDFEGGLREARRVARPGRRWC